MPIEILKNTIDDQYIKFLREDKKKRPMVLGKVGLQLINWVVNGSPRSSITPPVLTGALRGSGSVFIGDKFVGGTDFYPVTGDGVRTINRSHSGKENEVTIGFNTAYAAKWHENPFTPGKFSQQSGDVGNKYVEVHLKADRLDLTKLFALLYSKEMGTK
jgi:hypothetical protein